MLFNLKDNLLNQAKSEGIIYDLSGLDTDTIQQIVEKPAMWRKLCDKLLGVASDPKTVKGEKYQMLTGVMYLSPAELSGCNLCPMAKLAQCEAACLNTAGRGQMSNVQMARLRKTLMWLQYRDEFIALLDKEIAKLAKRAASRGFTPLVRLNGTSDIRWENYISDIMEAHQDVQFYDYTKIANRRNLPSNYDLTFSYSGVASYQKYVEIAKAAGYRIAVVFRHKEAIPSTFIGLDCVDGDDSDIRHLDPQGVIVALYAKGQAVHDQSGFVVG